MKGVRVGLFLIYTASLWRRFFFIRSITERRVISCHEVTYRAVRHIEPKAYRHYFVTRFDVQTCSVCSMCASFAALDLRSAQELPHSGTLILIFPFYAKYFNIFRNNFYITRLINFPNSYNIILYVNKNTYVFIKTGGMTYGNTRIDA